MSAPATATTKRPRASAEAAGYVATVAFLVAYLLNVAGTGVIVQGGLNLVGAVVAAGYLYGKRAMPSVISNVAWAVITVAGLIVR